MEGKEGSLDQSKFKKIKVGDTIEINDQPALIGGRASRLPGYDVYKVGGFEDNATVSRFGVQIKYIDSQIIVSRPKLNLNGEAYLATNKIIVLDTGGQQIEIQDEYNAGYGNNIYRIFVGDERIQNGFILEMIGNKDMRLNATVSNGVEVKWESK